ncbi:hypothetical protein J3R30DRAFT_3715202 [Lentinula aciculospora]|uniref:RING-type E3 ubiquitin transferase n=1 Tax=Lentinula aciculospora TaxID=153920 RepID=A0A9W9DGE9_9AGAR|nr:hypothetical protein J3R30DRAFT_3715202 [Lentinula aciculospora]
MDQLVRRSSQAFLASVTSHRILVYGLLSTFAVLATIGNALKSHSNFYSVTIYLSKSSRSILILANFSFLLALIGGHIVQRIFFGSLRPNEVERLYERLWFFITESLLAFTIFRDEFDIPFAIMFGFLLFVKSFHWLANDRVEWMDQRPYPGPPLLFHVRMSVLFAILWSTDLLMFLIAVENTLAHGVGGMVLFASEYGILMATVTNTISKYLLSAYDFRRAGQRGGETAPPWENKSMWVFYIELATGNILSNGTVHFPLLNPSELDFLKLTTYLIFFTIIITFYGLPLNIVRDVYITARSFITRLRALHRYQTATRNMDQRYPNASEEEMAAMSDRTCIICREEMLIQRPGAPATEGPNMTPKKLPCGHVFHFYCLRSWLERQQSCPTWYYRRTVLDNDPLDRRQGAVRNDPIPPAPQQPARGQVGEIGAQDLNGPAGVVNNPLGLVGRFFGAQAQMNRPLNGGQLPNVHNAAGQTGGIVIQYNIHYQPVQQQTEPPIQHEPLQPAPRLQRFQGPGEIWHLWPEPGIETGQENTTSEDASQSVPAPSSDSDTSPRAAAALAASRRMNSQIETKNAPMNESSQPETAPYTAPALIPLFGFDIESPASASTSAILAKRLTPDSASITLPTSTAPLTDEQLALMDRTTREAIDERLKVLEGVSTAVYQCIDDLIRMRSALPPLDTNSRAEASEYNPTDTVDQSDITPVPVE